MIEVAANNGVFNLTSAEDFFKCLEVALMQYKESTTKQIEIALFLVMGANHLREWIAPGCDHKKKDKTEAEAFYCKIFDDPNFKIVNQLCNHAKHLEGVSQKTSYAGELNIDDWPGLIDDLIGDWDSGPPTGFFVDGVEIGDVLTSLLDKYRSDWFNLKLV
jgi:hypothetical protein